MGRPHIGQALLEKGYVSNMQEVFTRYIGQGGPAYVDRHKLTPQEAIGVILKSGGLPVLAHPTTANDTENMIAHMAQVGLAGIEVYYKDYDSKQRHTFAKLAKKYNLIATGGSDYHGLDESTEVMLGEANVPIQAARSLFSLAEERGMF
jgi:predicted metal-dependent phosphoesterase TrpH